MVTGAVVADRKLQPPQTTHSNPMQLISQLQQNGKGKQRSYSRAYESPRNGQFAQYSSRKNGSGKAVSSTGSGVPNQRRINQTIEVGSNMKHLDLEIEQSSTPNDLATIQPVDLSSPMGGARIPHQPVTPNLTMQGANGPGGVNNFMAQRQSPLTVKQENNFVANIATGIQKSSLGP